MAAKIRKLPGVAAEAARILIDSVNALIDESAAARRAPRTTALQRSGYVASEGETVRLRGGQRLTLPRSRTENAGALVHVILETSGSSVVVAHRGTVDGAAAATIYEPGLYLYQSNGIGGWFSTAGLDVATLAAADWAWTGSHTFSGSFVTASVSGAFRADAGTDILLNATSGIAITAGAGLVPITTSNDGNIVCRAESGFFVFTGATPNERLQIEDDGAWQLSGDTGISRQAFTSAGSGAPPTWEYVTHGLTSRTSDTTSTSSVAALIVTKAIDADSTVSGTTFRLEGFVTYTKTATGTTDPRFFLQWAGSNILAIQINQNANAGTYLFHVRAMLTIRTAGAGGTYAAGLCVLGGYTDANSATTDAIGPQPARVDMVSGSVNTTVSNNLSLAIAIEGAVASNSITGTLGTIERVHL